jgi:hypothetical protein
MAYRQAKEESDLFAFFAEKFARRTRALQSPEWQIAVTRLESSNP